MLDIDQRNGGDSWFAERRASILPTECTELAAAGCTSCSGTPQASAAALAGLRPASMSVPMALVLREGGNVRKVSKREAILRGLVVTALKGDLKSIATLLRVAEQTGEFGDSDLAGSTTKMVVSWACDGQEG